MTLQEIKDTARDQNSASGDWRGGVKTPDAPKAAFEAGAFAKDPQGVDGLLKDATRPPGAPDAARETAERHALERAHGLD